MSIFALPALFALLTKMWVYVFARKTNHTSQTFLCLLVFFAVHNLSEFIVIAQFFNTDLTESFSLRAYYVALLFAVGYMCIFAMSVVTQDNNNRFHISIYVIAFSLSLITLFTDWIIAGSLSLGYTVTAKKGDYYFIFQLTVLLSFTWIVYTLIQRYMTTLNIHVQLKCFYAILALSPIIVMSLFVMLMMQMGFQYSGAILLPFASTFVLLIVIKTEKDNDLIRVRDRLPFTASRRAERKIISVYREHIDGIIEFPEARERIEKIIIENALERAGNNKTLAANLLGIKRGRLYSIFNRLEISDQKMND